MLLPPPPSGPLMLTWWGSDRLSLGPDLKEREPVSLPHEGNKPQRKEESTYTLHGPHQSQGLLACLQEYPPWPTPAPGVTLIPGGLHSILAQLPPSTSLGPAIKEKESTSLIRLLSLSVYILNKTGTAVNKVKSLLKS